MVSSAQLARALMALAGEEKNQDKALEKFFNFLQHYKLESMLPGVLQELTRFAEEEKRKEQVAVVTAKPLSQSAKTHIKTIIGADTHTAMTEDVQKDLLGGFRARYKGFEYQGSLSHHVDTLEKQLQSEA